MASHPSTIRASKNLVLSTVGDRSRHPSWIDDPETRQFDLMLIYYGTNESYDFGTAEYTFRRRGFKYQLLHWVWEEAASILKSYDRIWCPDDDIRSTTSDVNRLFDIFEERDLSIAQPAIAAGDLSYRLLKQSPRMSLRYTPFVEVMCPIFSMAAFEKVQPLFLESKSGWGLDWVWSKWFGMENMAIVDEVGVHHTGKLGGGELYKKLKAIGIDPIVEFDTLVAKHGGIDDRLKRRVSKGTAKTRDLLRAGESPTLWERIATTIGRAA